MKAFEPEIKIQITGTIHDANFIKRMMRLYLPVASKRQKEEIGAYIAFIDSAVRKATSEG